MLLSVTSFYGQWANWLPLSLMAIMIAITILALLREFAKVLRIQELENFATAEMMQAFVTGFMAIFLVFMVSGALELAHRLIAGQITCADVAIRIGSTEKSTMDEAFDALRCRVQSRSKELASIQDYILTSPSIQAQFNALQLSFSILGITVFKGDWVGYLYKNTETVRIINNLITVLLIALNAQSSLLLYLKTNMLHVFIPFGILLRSFYFTRSAGAFLISIGIGMYFLFPVFYFLTDPGFIPSKPLPPSTLTVKPFCYPTMSSAVTLLSNLESSGLGSTSELTLSSIREDIGKSYLSLILHPLISLFLTLVFVRYLMSILGADTYELIKLVGKVI